MAGHLAEHGSRVRAVYRRDQSAPAPRPRGSSSGDPLVSIDDIRAAAATLAGVTVRTPLLPFGDPSTATPKGHPRLWLKPEILQPIGAFKLRGAYNALASLSADERAAGVVSHSCGNHAQGVARAARLLGIRAVVVMPTDAPGRQGRRACAPTAPRS